MKNKNKKTEKNISKKQLIDKLVLKHIKGGRKAGCFHEDACNGQKKAGCFHKDACNGGDK